MRRDGEEIGVLAETVVLAAGAYGSPAILQRSGVGDPPHSRRLGIETRLELPGVGRNLHDHPIVELEFAGSDRLRQLLEESVAVRFTPEEQTIGKVCSSRSTGPYDLHVFPVAGHPHSLMAGPRLIAVAALEPRSRGRATVVGPDPEAAPGSTTAISRTPAGSISRFWPKAPSEVASLPRTEPLAVADRSRDRTEPRRPDRAVPRALLPPGRYVRDGGDSDPLAVCDGAGRVRGWPRSRGRRLLAHADRSPRQHQPAGRDHRRADRRRTSRRALG